MIEVKLEANARGQLVGFEVTGHAGYARAGRDIVCAAVSALAQGAVAGLKHFYRDQVQASQRKGKLKCHLIPMPSEADRLSYREAQAILIAMHLGLKAIAEQYPKHLRISSHIDQAEGGSPYG